MYENIDKYKDIINMPHYVSKKHPQMSIENRSAQFAPFAALTGYEDEVKETGRLTNKRVEITEEIKELLDFKLRYIKEKIGENPKVKITYFLPDHKKDGGKYLEEIGNVKKIDEYKQTIVLENKKEILINEIIDIEIKNK